MASTPKVASPDRSRLEWRNQAAFASALLKTPFLIGFTALTDQGRVVSWGDNSGASSGVAALDRNVLLQPGVQPILVETSGISLMCCLLMSSTLFQETMPLPT